MDDATHPNPARPRMSRRILRRVFARPFAIVDSAFLRIGQTETYARDLSQQTGQLRADVDALQGRQEQLADGLQTALALGWDHVALVRRLAALEDQVAALEARLAAAGSTAEPPCTPLARVG